MPQTNIATDNHDTVVTELAASEARKIRAAAFAAFI